MPLPTPTPVLFYVLVGGGSSDSAHRYVGSAEFGNTLNAGGWDSIFNTHSVTALSLGARGVYIQNPGGVTSIAPPSPHMQFDQFILAEATSGMGSTFLSRFTTALTTFIAAHPVPTLLYMGGLYDPPFTTTYASNYPSFSAYCDTCVAPIPVSPLIRIGYDSSLYDTSTSFAERYRASLHPTHPGYIEAYWAASAPHLSTYGCIIQDSVWTAPHYAFLTPRPDQEVIRLLDTNPSGYPTTDWRPALSSFLNSCRIHRHTAALPGQYWVPQNYNLIDLFNYSTQYKPIPIPARMTLSTTSRQFPPRQPF